VLAELGALYWPPAKTAVNVVALVIRYRAYHLRSAFTAPAATRSRAWPNGVA
jgi:hypothetical protein